MMGFGTSWFPKIGIIQLLNCRILMGLADWVILIGIIHHFCTQGTDVDRVAHITWLLRLTATIDAPAWTAHDLDEVIVSLAGFYHIEQFSGIAKSRSYSYLDIHASHMISSFFDAFGAADFREIYTGQFFTG